MARPGETRDLNTLLKVWQLRLAAAMAALLVSLAIMGCSSTPEAPEDGSEATQTSVAAVPTSLTAEPQVTPSPTVESAETAEPLATQTVAATETAESQVTPSPTVESAETADPTTPDVLVPDVATPEPVEPQVTPSTTQTASPANVPDMGGVARLAAREAFDHQDVHDSWSPALSTWGPGLAYSRLLRLKSGPDVRLPSLAVECDLCAEWRMTDDLTFEFDLRPDAAWQDIAPVNGRAVTAADVASSYIRQAEAGRPNAGLLRSIERFEITGASSFRIRLKLPDADFLSALADARSKIVAPQAVAENGDLRSGPTIGSGPWILTSMRSDGTIDFERNPAYFDAPMPYLDSLRIQVIEDDQTRTAAFLTGALDFHEFGPAGWNEFLEKRPFAPSYRVVQPGVGLELAMNLAGPPFDNISSRRTVLYVIDPWRTISEVWGGQAIVSLGSPVAEAGWLRNWQNLTQYFADSQAANDSLDRGPFNTFDVKVGDFGPEYIAHAELMVAELKDAGLDPKMEVLNRRAYGEEVWSGGSYQMSLGPIAPATMPNSYLLPVLHSRGTLNSASINDPELDALIEAQATEYDPAIRQDLFHQIQTLVFDRAYRLMPATRVSVWSWSPNMRGFYPNFGGFEYHHWAEVWLLGGG